MFGHVIGSCGSALRGHYCGPWQIDCGLQLVEGIQRQSSERGRYEGVLRDVVRTASLYLVMFGQANYFFYCYSLLLLFCGGVVPG